MKEFLKNQRLVLVLFPLLIFYRVIYAAGASQTSVYQHIGNLVLSLAAAVFLGGCFKKAGESEKKNTLIFICLALGTAAMIPFTLMSGSFVIAEACFFAALGISLFLPEGSAARLLSAVFMLAAALVEPAAALMLLPLAILIFLQGALKKGRLEVLGFASALLGLVAAAVALLIQKNDYAYPPAEASDIFISVLKALPAEILIAAFLIMSVVYTEKATRLLRGVFSFLLFAASLMPIAVALVFPPVFSSPLCIASLSVGLGATAAVSLIVSGDEGAKKAAAKADRPIVKYFILLLVFFIYILRVTQPILDLR